MSGLKQPKLQTPMRRAMDAAKRTLRRVAFFSFFVNLLTLTSSIYMLQVYDRVLASRSQSTLLYLTCLQRLAWRRWRCWKWCDRACWCVWGHVSTPSFRVRYLRKSSPVAAAGSPFATLTVCVPFSPGRIS